MCKPRRVLHKATGWFIVAAGASCLATGETWHMAQHFEWPTWLFVAVLLAMFAVVITGVMASVARLRRIMA